MRGIRAGLLWKESVPHKSGNVLLRSTILPLARKRLPKRVHIVQEQITRGDEASENRCRKKRADISNDRKFRTFLLHYDRVFYRRVDRQSNPGEDGGLAISSPPTRVAIPEGPIE
jgi:hypothetical protein